MPSAASPKVLVPLTITDSMITACSVAEPSASETAWVSGGTYAIGDRRIRAATHRKYECTAAHTGITTPPESDPNRWEDIGATDRWAMFDTYSTTQTKATTSLTVTLQPGFFNAIILYQANGATCVVTVKDAPGGTVIKTISQALNGPYLDEWDYCWGPYREKSKVRIENVMPYPNAEVTIAITASAGTAVGLGMIAIGDMRDLVLGDWGGTQYGAKAKPVDFSYIDFNKFGDVTIVKGVNATDLSITAIVPQAGADYALACIKDVLGTVAAFVGASVEGYDGLNTIGLTSGEVSYDSAGHAIATLNVKGIY